jgi:AcrR family transcriptional regulator
MNVKRDTRAEVIAAAWACFQALGAKAASADDIAARAGVSRSSFYRYFKGMGELIASMATEIGVANLRSALSQSGAEEGRVDWTLFVCNAVWGLLHDPRHAEIESTGANTVHTIYQARVGGYFVDLLALLLPSLEVDRGHGTLRSDRTAEDLAEWLLRQIWCLSSAPPPGGWSYDELLAYARTFITPGVAPCREPPDGSAPATDEVARLKDALVFIETYISTIPDLRPGSGLGAVADAPHTLAQANLSMDP